MSLKDIRTTRLNRMQVRKLVTEIAHKFPANIRFSKHALEELTKDNLTTSDALNVIKSPDAKIINEGELEKRILSVSLRNKSNFSSYLI